MGRSGLRTATRRRRGGAAIRIAINGAGIAGPTLAYWLRRAGHDVLLVEEAPRLRRGGYVIDFWGAGYEVADRMGLLPGIHGAGYRVQEVRFVDGRGRKRGGFGADVFHRMTDGRFTSLRRSDLAATIYDALDGEVETLFGDSVAGIEEAGAHLRIRFERAAPRDVDLAIGADGLHSRVRRLAFGPQTAFEVPLGYHAAAFEVAGYRPRDELVYVSHAVPGRQVSRFAMREDLTLFLFVFADEHLPAGHPSGQEECREALRHAFGTVDWECPRILAAMDEAPEIYFDRVSQIRMDRWAQGRVALVGDAAACVSLLAGEGTGLAMVEAYVLAGELRAAGGDHAQAFARYQERLRPFLKRKQVAAARFASSFAPKTAMGVAFRNLVTRLFAVPFLADLVIGRDLRDDLTLPAYGFE